MLSNKFAMRQKDNRAWECHKDIHEDDSFSTESIFDRNPSSLENRRFFPSWKKQGIIYLTCFAEWLQMRKIPLQGGTSHKTNWAHDKVCGCKYTVH